MTGLKEHTAGIKKILICMLAAAVMLAFAAPSFAADYALTEAEGTAQAEGAGGKSGDDAEVKDEEGAEEPGCSEEEAQAEEEQTETPPEEHAQPKTGSGITVQYTGERVGTDIGITTVFAVTSGGTEYTGTCAYQGVSMSASGTAEIQRIPNTEEVAKIVYHYAIELGDENWWTSSHKTDRVGKLLGMAHDTDTYVTKRRMVEAFCQIHNMGLDKWYEVITGPRGSWSINTATKVKNYYKNIDTGGIKVPDSFEIWLATPDDGAQAFIMWAHSPAGYTAVKKVSGNTSITG